MRPRCRTRTRSIRHCSGGWQRSARRATEGFCWCGRSVWPLAEPGLSSSRANESPPPIMKTFLLYVVTAIAEIVGCYFPYRWLKEDGSPWLLIPGALALALFAWLLTLHASAAGRVYAAYGGVYIGVAIMWLWIVERIRPTNSDVAGGAIARAGMSVIAFQPRG